MVHTGVFVLASCSVCRYLDKTKLFSPYSSAAPAGVQQAGAPPGAPPVGVQAGAQVPQQLTTNNVVQPTAQPTVVVATAAGIEPRTTSVSGPGPNRSVRDQTVLVHGSLSMLANRVKPMIRSS